MLSRFNDVTMLLIKLSEHRWKLLSSYFIVCIFLNNNIYEIYRKSVEPQRVFRSCENVDAYFLFFYVASLHIHFSNWNGTCDAYVILSYL